MVSYHFIKTPLQLTQPHAGSCNKTLLTVFKSHSGDVKWNSTADSHLSGAGDDFCKPPHTKTPCSPQYPTLSSAKVGLLLRAEVIPFFQHYEVLLLHWRLLQSFNILPKHKLMRVYPWPDKERGFALSTIQSCKSLPFHRLMKSFSTFTIPAVSQSCDIRNMSGWPTA